MCKQCVEDLERWHATGELPPAWEPSPAMTEAEQRRFDKQIAEINAELDAIESGAAEPPSLGWVSRIRVSA